MKPGAADGRRREMLIALLTVLPIPYVVLVTAMDLDAVRLGDAGFRLSGGSGLHGPAGIALAACVVVGLAWLPHAPERAARVLGGGLYAIVLFEAAGRGGVKAVLNAVGGAAGGARPGPTSATVVLGAGAILCSLALLAAAALIASELDRSQETGGR